MPEKLIIFGRSGFIGGHLARAAGEQQWEVYPTAQRIDITNAAAVEAAVEAIRPDAIVNAAAIADIDQAERESELAYQVNVTGARNVAASSQKRGIPCVF